MPRCTNFEIQHPVIAELKPGDILKSNTGKTYRTILMVADDKVIVEGKSGVVDALSFDAIRDFWLLMIPKEA